MFADPAVVFWCKLEACARQAWLMTGALAALEQDISEVSPEHLCADRGRTGCMQQVPASLLQFCCSY